eukprot:TRINITY_DN11730_c0_g1_i1.p1 TRINITY_DN11730_c0_g1~~TRINITY_DN11730_c0_g1_i1.p1  ORF type:complete len:115 (+),score=5.63 TRINITY_DN11730_c0_g1_i1:54-347(+)
MASVKILIFGATGRMGQRLCHLIAQDPELELIGGICHPEDKEIGQTVRSFVPSLPETCKAMCRATLGEFSPLPDVAIDFSSPEGLLVYTTTAHKLVI